MSELGSKERFDRLRESASLPTGTTQQPLTLPLHRYISIAKQMEAQIAVLGSSSVRELEHIFSLKYRYVAFFSWAISKHKDAASADVEPCRNTAVAYMNDLEVLKPKLLALYDEESVKRAAQEKASGAAEPVHEPLQPTAPPLPEKPQENQVHEAAQPTAPPLPEEPQENQVYLVGQRVRRKGRPAEIVDIDHGIFPPSYIVLMLDDSSQASCEARDLSPDTAGFCYVGPRPPAVWQLPVDLEERFLQCAQQNTDKNCETCGILMGKAEEGSIQITTVLIPQQIGSSNDCEMLCEEAVISFQIEEELLTVGWIHTHPSQGCFLSSVDLHTHLGYQQLLPQALAIVCAPTDRVGLFQLTEEGMSVVGSCSQSGFHDHNSTVPLFRDVPPTDVSRGGSLRLVDLRDNV